MKRKAERNGDEAETDGHAKRAATEEKKIAESNGYQESDRDILSRFGPGIFHGDTIKAYASSYATSTPYPHAVVSNLINDHLLRSVRHEILQNIHFTPKETDIYKIHQSGDLANLDGLDPSSLSKLPSLLQLRDALYSPQFRQWISTVSAAGPVSGRKTDMAVNVYVPGSHLLCHDDVIGTRRVSYILYLTDPEEPWREEWGGALRLYSVEEKVGEDGGGVFKVPRAEWEKSIPPKWNQLSFFAVRPGESFHDVEEVYHPAGEREGRMGRVRMAISGWFHIPQEGEEGFEPGLEEKMAERSSLQQLQGRAEQFDEPQDRWFQPGAAVAAGGNGKGKDVVEEGELSEEDLNFLLKFMTPNYLTPDTVEELQDLFAEESTLQLSNFLSPKFAAKLKDHISELDSSPNSVPEMQVSRPPHKHRYQYLQPSLPAASSPDPWKEVLNELLPSPAFRKWLALATGLELGQCKVLARRFRKGLDYQLAQSYEGEDPVLEYTLGITPTTGWGADESVTENGHDDAEGGPERNGDGEAKTESKDFKDEEEDEDNIGGYELYMAGEDPDDGASDPASAVDIPASVTQSATGAGHRPSAKKAKADPAIYKSAPEGGDGDDGILFSNPASWNTLSVVLRDAGTLRFVKYVSRKARGDRWDWTGAFEVIGDDGEEGDEEDDGVE